MFQNFGRNFSSTMPVSLSEWRVRIGTFVPRMPLSQYLDLTMKVFLALLNALADGESKVEPSEKETTDHQSSSEKPSSNPEKDGTPSGVNSDEQKAATATADQTNRVFKSSKKRKRRNQKGCCGPDQSCAFLSFRCFLKSGASPLLRFLLLVFTTILLIRSGDVEVNPGPNEGSTSVSDSTLLDIAKRIPQDKLYDLGINLGIDISSLRRHRATNTMGGAANWNGTLDMLVDWRDNTSIQQQEELLRNALISSSLHAVAEQYLPQDPTSREEGIAEMQNILDHPAHGQSTSHGGLNMASNLPELPVNPNHGAFADFSHMPCQSSHNTATYQYMYDASSNNQGFEHSRYSEGFHSNPKECWPFMSDTCSHTAYSCQDFCDPSYHQELHTLQSADRRISYPQPIDLSSSSGQFRLHGMASKQADSHTGVGVVAKRPGEMNTHPNMQTDSPILSSYPVVKKQKMVQNNFTPENEQGYMSASNQYQEPPYSNPSGLPAPFGSSLGQTPSCGMAAQTYPPTGPGSYSMQPRRPNTAPQMISADPHVQGMSSYHNPQEPTTYSHTTPVAHPASEIPPITDAQLKQCREEIKAFYEVNLCKIPTSPLDTDSLVELKCIFTNLVLLKEDKSIAKKENLPYKELLYIKINNQTAKRIMIQGEAGVGKTTFCAKIAWDWIEGTHYQDYALVAIVLLRDAKNNRTVGQILKTYLSDENQVTSEQLDKYIKENQDKVLTVFDGFDEFGSEMSNNMNPIVQILNCRSIKSGTVIVTTRPWKAHGIAKRMSEAKQYAFVRIDGFKRKDVRTYVTKFYRDDNTSAQSLLEFMEEGSLITETMAPFPIFCSMLCHMWKEVERREVIRKLQTFSQLFQEMIIQLEEQYISKHATTDTFDSEPVVAQDIKGKIDDHLKRISEIAFNGLLNNKLAFLEREFESCADDLCVAYGVGILTREKTMCKREHAAVRKVSTEDFTFSFPHKLFQEYTAAKHLQDLFNSNPDEFHEIMEQSIFPKATEFKYLLYFTGSFDDKLAKNVLTGLINWEVKMDLVVEVAFEGHSEDAASVIEEQCRDMLRSLTIEKGTSLHAIASYMFVLKQLESLCIKRMPHTKILSRNLAEKVCSLKTLKELQLEGCKITVSFSEILLQHSNEILIETFILQAVKLSQNSSINLARSICCLPHLKKFELSTDGSGKDFLAALHSETSQSKITSLALEMRISESESPNLVASICAFPYLKDLKLVCKNISDEFFCALKQQATSLKVESLDLSLGDISELGSQSLAAFICSMPCLRSVRVKSISKDAGKLKATLMKDVHIDESSPPLPPIPPPPPPPLSLPSSSSSSSSRVIPSTCQINIEMDEKLLIAFLSFLVPSITAKIESLEIHQSFYRRDINKSASHYLCTNICTMPFLKNLKLAVHLSDEFYTTLRKGASSLKIEQMHLLGVCLERSDSLSAFALMQNLVSLTLFDVRISDNSKHTEKEGKDPSDTLSSTSLTELNVDHASFISLCGMGLLKRFPLIQKMTLAFHDGQTPFPQELLHHVTMPAVMDLTLHGYYKNNYASLTSLSLVPFPNLVNLSLMNIWIRRDHCMAILESLRNEKTLKTISIKYCDTDAGLDPLCNEINAEGKVTVTVQHGPSPYLFLEEVFRDVKIGAEDLQVMSQDDES